MVDLPNQAGPMCDWPRVQAVDGAKACLQRLSQHAQCHLATNAEDSTEAQIRLALIDPRYYQTIADKLKVSPKQITMVGDSLERDVHQALKAGIKAVWFHPNSVCTESDILTIEKLDMLN
jgi:anthranilate/para-aminobenzoate synthase component II